MTTPTDPAQDPNEPIRRGEYERRHRALRGQYEAFAKRSSGILKFIVIVVLATAALSTYLLHENGKRTKESAEFSATLSKGIIESCQENGNPLRAAVRQFSGVLITQVRRNIAQSAAFLKSGAYEEIFPNYPPAKLEALLVKNRREELGTIRGLQAATERISAVNCVAQFEK